ncbi:MAG: paraquat-inducible protein A [Gammaproteobacteria bacterium]|nr:paraquat-inducible protein A [Gammaproteobacteria bacterium]MBU1645299.1 paraquat-inducible protein A [Gammaproteobacteria bacterium]MBU1972292.1 paraquat-inducible protein A [Gammaproteobacteria bacterium]
METPPAAFVACLECDLLHRRTPLPPGGEARCKRCGARLYRAAPADANERALALALTACILFIVANAYPIVGLDVQGVRNSATLFGAVESLWDDEARAVAVLVFVTTILVPAAELIGLTWVLLALRQGERGYGAVPLLHFIESVKPWAMVEVFVLGVLVSLVKLAHIAIIEPGVALFSFGGLMLFIAAASAAFDPDAAWSQLEATQ